MPVFGCVQGRVIARTMCTTRLHHAGSPKSPISLNSLRNNALGKRWCPGEDSNLHGFHHWYLKPARLPIPPPGHWLLNTGRGNTLSMTAPPRRAGSKRRSGPRKALRIQSPHPGVLGKVRRRRPPPGCSRRLRRHRRRRATEVQTDGFAGGSSEASFRHERGVAPPQGPFAGGRDAGLRSARGGQSTTGSGANSRLRADRCSKRRRKLRFRSDLLQRAGDRDRACLV